MPFKFIMALLLLLITSTGCDLLKTEKDDLLIRSVTEIEDQIDQEEWDKAISDIHDFQELYDSRKWKLQLLGELEDYKQIELEILGLQQSLKEEDFMEAKIGVGHIKHRLNMIYNM
ncbi:hypothetical protein J2Z83_002288 [Virgibacillus natechei]|uniref:DUF4363 family protein n=1 Tax=Virgibacillus natechei TaxID=1216297 RepID=A0ABS4IGW2_9BACI|nr:DUF4363 family protein [Virgibacillus natechei]MBP1970170.1 hypothetical protein [Virgibacillus natechei]UZD12877.1 DUF4363 family protein [Virgibacillus natechei]